jgi:hypothetical protein
MFNVIPSGPSVMLLAVCCLVVVPDIVIDTGISSCLTPFTERVTVADASVV